MKKNYLKCSCGTRIFVPKEIKCSVCRQRLTGWKTRYEANLEDVRKIESMKSENVFQAMYRAAT